MTMIFPCMKIKFYIGHDLIAPKVFMCKTSRIKIPDKMFIFIHENAIFMYGNFIFMHGEWHVTSQIKVSRGDRGESGFE